MDINKRVATMNKNCPWLDIPHEAGTKEYAEGLLELFPDHVLRQDGDWWYTELDL